MREGGEHGCLFLHSAGHFTRSCVWCVSPTSFSTEKSACVWVCVLRYIGGIWRRRAHGRLLFHLFSSFLFPFRLLGPEGTLQFGPWVNLALLKELPLLTLEEIEDRHAMFTHAYSSEYRSQDIQTYLLWRSHSLVTKLQVLNWHFKSFWKSHELKQRFFYKSLERS